MNAHMILAVAAGGALGAVLRYVISDSVDRATRSSLPWGTLAVNILGSLAVGILWSLFDRYAPSPAVRAFLISGLLGSLTTFSAYSIATVLVADQHGAWPAVLHVLAHNVLCIAAAAGGYLAIKALVH